jgi:6,7-dimethyl-8-ribityllumazine synthase
MGRSFIIYHSSFIIPMLTPIKSKTFQAGKARFAIIASQYNARYVEAMLQAAQAELERAGAKEVRVVRVPGAYEIPIVAARLARTGSPHASRTTHHAPHISAIICLGVILRGETVHAAHIGEAVSRALMEIQVQHEVPVIHEVLLLENEEQARARCLDPKRNRGREAAQTALAMAQVMASLGQEKPLGRGVRDEGRGSTGTKALPEFADGL